MAKITDKEINAALKRVAKKLRAGYYADVSEPEGIWWDLDYTSGDYGGVAAWVKNKFKKASVKLGFNMGQTALPLKGCGTICCIGGAMAYELGAKGPAAASRLMDRVARGKRYYEEGVPPERVKLYDLFYNYPEDTHVPPKRAAKAIDRYLAGRKAWPGCPTYGQTHSHEGA